MIIRSDNCLGVQVQFVLRTFRNGFFGVPCCKTPCGDGFILEVHHTQRKQLEQAFKKWFVSEFGKYLTKRENIDSIFEQLRRHEPRNIEMLDERIQHWMDMEFSEDWMETGKKSKNIAVKAWFCYLGTIARVVYEVKEKGILSRRVTGPHSAIMRSLEFYHALVKMPVTDNNIKITFQNEFDNGVTVCRACNLKECPVKGDDADYEIIINSINKARHYFLTNAPVYKRYMLILEEFHHVQRACQRITGQRVMNFELFKDKKFVDTDQETKNLILALEYFKRITKNILDNPPFSKPVHEEILGIRIVPTCVERNASKQSVLYVFSRERIEVLLSRIKNELERMPMSVEREISALHQSTSKNGISGHQGSLEEKRKRLVRHTPRKERWYLLCVVLLLVVYAYSPILSGVILGILLWIAFRDTGEEPKGSSHRDPSKGSSHRDSSKVSSHRDSTKGSSHRDSSKVSSSQDSSKVSSHRDSTKGSSHRDSTKVSSERDSSKGSSRQDSSKGSSHRDSSKGSSHRDSTKVSSRQDSSKSSMKPSSRDSRRLRELHDQRAQKERLQELQEMIANFLRLNPHCFCVALERPCTGVERYTISNIGDFEEY